MPDDERERERAIFEAAGRREQAAEVREKIAEGRLRKWLEEVVLLNQPHVNADKHEGRTIEQLRTELSPEPARTLSSGASPASRSATEPIGIPGVSEAARQRRKASFPAVCC